MKKLWATVMVGLLISAYGQAAIGADENAPIVVWLDETRVPAVEAWTDGTSGAGRSGDR